jgi:hypothetical protein
MNPVYILAWKTTKNYIQLSNGDFILKSPHNGEWFYQHGTYMSKLVGCLSREEAIEEYKKQTGNEVTL